MARKTRDPKILTILEPLNYSFCAVFFTSFLAILRELYPMLALSPDLSFLLPLNCRVLVPPSVFSLQRNLHLSNQPSIILQDA